MNKIPLLIAALIFPCIAYSQEGSPTLTNPQDQAEPALVTDRPDQTESALVVPAWRLQIETGAAKEWVSSESDSYDENNRFGTTLLRYGLFDFMEFRIGSDLLNHQSKLPAGASRFDCWQVGGVR